MQLNMWNDLAKAKRRWTEKTYLPSLQIHVQPLGFCRPVTIYSSLLLCLRRHARCFDFHVSLNVVVDNSFWHVFERGQTAVSLGKSSFVVFLFGLLPLLCVWFAILL